MLRHLPRAWGEPQSFYSSEDGFGKQSSKPCSVCANNTPGLPLLPTFSVFSRKRENKWIVSSVLFLKQKVKRKAWDWKGRCVRENSHLFPLAILLYLDQWVPRIHVFLFEKAYFCKTLPSRFLLAVSAKYPAMPSHLGAVTIIDYECCPALSSCSPNICIDLLFIALACTFFEAKPSVWAVCGLWWDSASGQVLVFSDFHWRFVSIQGTSAQPCHTWWMC